MIYTLPGGGILEFAEKSDWQCIRQVDNHIQAERQF